MRNQIPENDKKPEERKEKRMKKEEIYYIASHSTYPSDVLHYR